MAFIAQGNKKKNGTMSSKQSPALNMTSGAGTLFHWAALRMTSSASSTRPFCKSQRGDSGIKLHTQEQWKAYSKTCTSKQDFSRFSVNMRYLSQLSPKCHPGWLTAVLSFLNWSWVNFAFEKLVSCARKKDSEAGLCFMCVPFWFLKENKRLIATLSKTLSGFDSITVFSNASSVMYGFDVLCDTRCN